jgi:hypothetical protein
LHADLHGLQCSHEDIRAHAGWCAQAPGLAPGTKVGGHSLV